MAGRRPRQGEQHEDPVQQPRHGLTGTWMTCLLLTNDSICVQLLSAYAIYFSITKIPTIIYFSINYLENRKR